jgi:uncharacterized delta-60 repeat protein
MKTRLICLATALSVFTPSIHAQQYQWSTPLGLADNPGSANGTGSSARFSAPLDVAVGANGLLYVADTGNQTLRAVTTANAVSTLAGSVGSSGSTNGTGSAARFYNPSGVAVDSSGNIYVADYWNHTIRKVTPAGAVSTLAGSAGNLGSTNGTGSAARFYYPASVAVDSSGNVYVADNYNDAIRKVTPAGVVTTLAGSPGNPGSANGTGSAARFDAPAGVAVDSSGHVYVGDRSNHTIRKITPAGVVTTLAGSAGSFGSTNATGSAARFYFPAGVAVDAAGNVYVADTYNDAIRRITPAGAVTTIGGSPGSIGSADGTGSTARFDDPFGVTVASNGVLHVADRANHTIRRGVPLIPEIALSGNGQPIASGASPSLSTHTDFGSASLGGTVTRTFTITNTGWANLNLTGSPKVQISGTHAAEFIVTAQPGSPLTVSDADDFIITFTPGNSGLRTATVTIANNDPDEGTFTFALQGTGLSPEIAVTGNGQNITDGDVTPSLTDHTDYGSTPLGTPVTRSFTLTNTGGLDLNVTGLTVPTGYEHVGTFAPFTLAPAAAQVVQVRFLANTVNGTFSGTMALLSNDVDEGSFDISLTATAISGGNPAALDLTFDADGAGGALPGGMVTTAVGSSHDYGYCVAVQSDGKIVVAGSSFNGSNNDFALVRYNINGSPDSTFGSSGKVTTPIDSNNDGGYSVAVQGDGKIVVAGYSSNGGNDDFALVRYNPNGSLDNGFGSGGKVTTAIGSGHDTGQSVAVQADGKLVVAGISWNGSNDDFAVVRYHSNGTLDTSFNGTGKVTTNFGSSYDFGRSVVVQADGKIVVAGTSNNGSINDFALVRYNTNGSLDTSFGNGGKVTTDFGGSQDAGLSVVVQADGKLVVAGYSGYDFALVRYNTNGSLDTGFGGTGKVTTDFGSSQDEGHSVVVQSDGKLVVAGTSNTGGNYDFALVCYNADGSLDTSFGNGGKVTTAIGSSYDVGQSVAVQTDRKIVVAGYSWNGSNTDFALVRYGADLTPTLTTAAATGLTTTTATLNGTVNPNGVITSAWFEYGLTTSYGSSTSSQDIGYGTSAVARAENLTSLTPGTLYHYRLVAQNGMTTVYGANQTFTTLTPAPEIALFDGPTDASPALADGQASALDFGVTPLGTPVTRSLTVKNVGTADLNLTDLTLPSGYEHVGTFTPFTLAAGATQTFDVRFLAHTVPGNFSGTMSLLSNDADEGSFDINLTATAIIGGNPAALDLTFDADGPGGPLPGGMVTTAIGGGDVGQSVVVQNDGKIVVAGNSHNGSNFDFALVRYTNSGVPDTTFGAGGKVSTPIGSGSDVGYSLALQSDGKIVVAGYSHNGSNLDFALVRYTSGGALDTTFGTDGKVTTAIGSNHDVCYGVALQSDGKIVVAGYSHNGSNRDFALVRYLSSGALDTTFGADGKVTTAMGSGDDVGYGVALQSDGKIVVAGASVINSYYDFALVRYTSSGALDNSFGSAGKVTTAIGSSSDVGHSVALQSDGKIVVAGYSFNGGNQEFALVRYDESGILDTTFGSGGKVTTVIGVERDIAHSVAVQSDGKIVVAGYSDNFSNSQFALAKYTSSGALDTAFGIGGKITTNIGGSYDWGYGVALQSDGRIVAAGYSSNGGDTYFAVVRYGADLAPTVTTLAATHISGPIFTLHGTVIPNGVTTSAWFEMGLTTSYGVTTPSQAIGFGTAAVAMSAPITWPPGETVHYRLVAQNGTTTAYGADMTFTTPNNNASLSALTLSSGTLDPPLAPSTPSYTANVPNAVTSLTVTPTAADASAFAITVNGITQISGNPSSQIPLNVGSNTINIIVTAEDQITTRHYTVTVTRAASSNAELSSLYVGINPLVPTFLASITSYAVSVPFNASSVSVGAFAADFNASMSVFNASGFPVGNSFTGSVNMIGQNSLTLQVNVYAQDFTIKTYTVQITRQTAFETWAATSGLPPGATPTGDHDNDGVSNFLEFVFGTEPAASGSGPGVIEVTNGVITQRGTPTVRVQNIPNSVDFRALFGRRIGHDTEGLTYTVQFSADMTIWQNSTATPTVIAEDYGIQACTVPYPFFIHGKKARFFRVNVTSTP